MPRRSRAAAWRASALGLLLAIADPVARADAEDAQDLLWTGKEAVGAGLDRGDAPLLRDGIRRLKRARFLLEARRASGQIGEGERVRIARDLEEIATWQAGAEESLLELDARSGPPSTGPSPGARPEDAYDPADEDARSGSAEVHARALKEGERLGAWVKDALAQYANADGAGRAALAVHMAKTADVVAVPALLGLFDREEDARAREGVHEALALVGTSRVAGPMGELARRSEQARWPRALDVVYRALERGDREEPEKPWCRAIRSFHRLKERALSLSILQRLDALGTPGVAALGEILYLDDFGCHTTAIQMLSTKRDRRAVPPLVFKLNRFKFEAMEQLPAHKALLGMGWHAVPELIDRLDDKAAGIWISWILRKITGETMGTDKRKWHDWWKHASLQHPELFDDPAERPGGAPAPVTPR
jgi:hypothetical protein